MKKRIAACLLLILMLGMTGCANGKKSEAYYQKIVADCFAYSKKHLSFTDDDVELYKDSETTIYYRESDGYYYIKFADGYAEFRYQDSKHMEGLLDLTYIEDHQDSMKEVYTVSYLRE